MSGIYYLALKSGAGLTKSLKLTLDLGYVWALILSLCFSQVFTQMDLTKGHFVAEFKLIKITTVVLCHVTLLSSQHILPKYTLYFRTFFHNRKNACFAIENFLTT